MEEELSRLGGSFKVNKSIWELETLNLTPSWNFFNVSPYISKHYFWIVNDATNEWRVELSMALTELNIAAPNPANAYPILMLYFNSFTTYILVYDIICLPFQSFFCAFFEATLTMSDKTRKYIHTHMFKDIRFGFHLKKLKVT